MVRAGGSKDRDLWGREVGPLALPGRTCTGQRVQGVPRPHELWRPHAPSGPEACRLSGSRAEGVA